MKFTLFHLMPYRPLDLVAAKQYQSAWMLTPNSLYDPEQGADLYESYISQLASAETLGFDAAAVNEHHQTYYGLMPAPNLIASALIQRTKTIRIAILGRALPLVNNPLNIAEEFAMLDVMSRGRIIAGFVRGIGAEYHSTGINPAFSHERFHEAHDLIVKAWTETGPFEFEGEHFRFRYVNTLPRPFQRPHPPIWIPSQGSAETIRWASAPERRYPFLVTFTAETAVTRYLNMYRDQARAYGYEPAADQMGWAAPVYVAETDERARAEAKAGAETMFNNFIPMPMEMLMPAGHTSIASHKAVLKLRKASLGSKAMGAQTIDELIANGVVVAGSPATVRERIERMRDRTGLNSFVPMMQFGVMPDDLARRSMELFASEVMPRLRD